MIHSSTNPSTSSSQRPSPLHRTPWAPAASSHDPPATSHQLWCPRTTVTTARAPPHLPVPCIGVTLCGGHSLFSVCSCSSSGDSFSADLPPEALTSAPFSSSLHPLRPSVGLSSPGQQPWPVGASPGHPHRGAAHNSWSLAHSTAPLQLPAGTSGSCTW